MRAIISTSKSSYNSHLPLPVEEKKFSCKCLTVCRTRKILVVKEKIERRKQDYIVRIKVNIYFSTSRYEKKESASPVQ